MLPYVAEQHVKEDLGRIPTVSDWLRNLLPEGWMSRNPGLLPSRSLRAPAPSSDLATAAACAAAVLAELSERLDDDQRAVLASLQRALGDPPAAAPPPESGP